MLTRAQWNADETWRQGRPAYNPLMQQVHLHHTATGNGYRRADVASLIRGIYHYHTHVLGWSDIGYNFLVDRFGRIWEGRAGGVARPVRGAHTRGFNGTSTGVAVIGSFDLAVPGRRVINGVARVAAWKVHDFGGRPRGRAIVRSEGSDRFPRNDLVSLPVIDGHRDTNVTSCPGGHLYAALPRVRRRARALILRARGARESVGILAPATLTGSSVVGRTLTIRPGTYDPPEARLTYTWMRNGEAVAGITGASYRCRPEDFGARLSVRVEARAARSRPARQTLGAAARVSAPTTVEVRAVNRVTWVTVRVRVMPAAGVRRAVSGKVAVRVRQRRKVVDLVDGRAVARFARLRPGRAEVAAVFRGQEGFRRASTQTLVRIGRA